MEPFGLLDFLKPLLALTQNAQSAPPPQAAAVEEEAPLPESSENTSSSTPDSPTQNAFLSFLETHEARANRLRKR